MVELERGLNESQIRYITHEVFVGLEYLHSLKGERKRARLLSLTHPLISHMQSPCTLHRRVGWGWGGRKEHVFTRSCTFADVDTDKREKQTNCNDER